MTILKTRPRATKKIGDVCQLVNGRAFKPSDWTKEGLRIIRIQNLNNQDAPFNRYKGSFLPKHLVVDGDVLLSWSGTPGTSFGCFIWNRGEAILNQHIFKVHVNEEVYDKEYFVFAVNSELGEMIHQAHGAVGLRHITKGRLEDMDIPFVPKKEQLRVVSRVKECLVRVDEMKRLREEAFAESNLLFSSTLRELFLKFERGPKATLGGVATHTQYGTSVKSSELGNGTPILRIPNVADGSVNLEKLKFAPLSKAEHEKIRLQYGDLLVVRTNGSPELVGRCAVFGLEGDYGYASYLIRFRLDQKRVEPEFVNCFLRSPQGREEIAKIRQTSAGQYNVNSENLRNIPIPVPNIKKQRELVEIATEAKAATDGILVELQATEGECDTLRDSIFREAFAGNL